jgi:hypothetical protein
MKLFRIAMLGGMLAVAPFAANAAGVYYLVTDQSNANTTIDKDHMMMWTAPDSGQGCLVTGNPTPCAGVSSPYFSPTFDWALGGGSFVIKDNGATGNITLSVYEGIVSGNPTAGLTSTLGLVDSVTLLPNQVTNQFTAIDFLFTNPVTLLSGHQYTVILSSATGGNGSNQYSIKGIESLSIQSSTTTTNETTTLAPPDPGPGPSEAPEPSTWFLMSGLVGVAGFAKRRGFRF